MTEWSLRPGTIREAAKRFLENGGAPPAGVKIIARYHKCDMSGGVTIQETDDPKALHEYGVMWADLIDLRVSPVVGDAEAGPHLAKHYA